MTLKKEILKIIDDALSKNLDYESFNEKFYNYYHLNYINHDDLDSFTESFINIVNESFEYCVANEPSVEDRSYGYHSYQEFFSWLQKAYNIYLNYPHKWEGLMGLYIYPKSQNINKNRVMNP